MLFLEIIFFKVLPPSGFGIRIANFNQVGVPKTLNLIYVEIIPGC